MAKANTPTAPVAPPAVEGEDVKQATITPSNLKRIRVADLRGSFSSHCFFNDDCIAEDVTDEAFEAVKAVFGDAVETL